MAILDHVVVPSHDRHSSAMLLSALLDVPWESDAMGIFSSVYVNESLTFDFADGRDFESHHYCFMVTEEEFDAIFSRLTAKGISYRSTPHGPMDMKINTSWGGRNLYWLDQDGHNWEILTVSYARPATPATGSTRE